MCPRFVRALALTSSRVSSASAALLTTGLAAYSALLAARCLLRTACRALLAAHCLLRIASFGSTLRSFHTCSTRSWPSPLLLAISAPSSAQWLQRLRTQLVDVDKSGRPCKERQASVRWQGPLATANNAPRTPADAAAAAATAASRWEVVECGGDEAELRAALALRGLSDPAVLREVLGGQHDSYRS